MDQSTFIARRFLLHRLAATTFLLPAGHALARSHAASSAKPHAKPAPPHPGARSRSDKYSGARPAAPAEPLPVVMLDPGHGGKDPGAIGYSGTFEKQVALATALELQRQLRASGRYRVELTRTRDVFVPLEDRVEAALRQRAWLFVSMHADAIGDPAIRGASVYTLSNGPSDRQTAALAERENSADRYAPHPRHRPLPDYGPDMSEIIMNMGRSQARANSGRLARDLVTSLDSDLPMLPRPERHAGFVVLNSGSIPSVLVEMGFMSNPRDEAALRKPGHRRLVAQAMHRAVDAYFGATRA